MNPIADRRRLLKRFFDARFVRFMIGGAVNTALSYIAYLALLAVADFRLAYSLAYVFGLVCGYLINAWWVFGSGTAARSALAYPAVYAAQYAAGLGLLHVLVEYAAVPKPIAPLLVLSVTVPLTYLLLSLVFPKRNRHDSLAKHQ